MIESSFGQDNLNRYLLKSIYVHLAILFLAIVAHIASDLKFFQFEKPPKKVEVVQTAVRIDVVGLPKHTLQELKKIDLSQVAEEPVKETTSKSNETSKVEFKTKRKKVNLSNLLKKFSTKKVQKIKVKRNKAIDTSKLNNLILEGNKLSKGSSSTGNEMSEAAQMFVRYIQSVPDKVKPNWRLPSYLIDKELSCRIRVYIGSNGQIMRSEIYESSGDNEYDKKALEAVKRTVRLPKPHKDIMARVANGDVILGFPL